MRPHLAILLMVIQPLGASTLHIDFSHEVGNARLHIDSLRYENSASETLSFTRIAWLASGFSLTTASGETMVIPDSHAYISETGGHLSLPGLPDEKIKAITFHIGPDKEANHSDPASHGAGHPLNPNLNKLHWDWQGGYIFLAIEGHWRTKDQKLPGGYAYHFARDPNRTSITLPLDLDLRDETTIAIALDPMKLLAGLSLATDGATTHSAEGDPVSARIKENLPGAFRIAAILKGGIPTPINPPAPIDLPANPVGYPLTFPRNIPLPSLPTDNPVLTTRVALGEKLFNEPMLSRTGAISCASCHQGQALNDPRKLSPGVDGKSGNRHSMPLFNLAWKTSFLWDGRAPSLREQALIPIRDHLEMDESLDKVAAKLKADQAYPALFAAAFGSGNITPENIGLAIENFLLTRLSFDSKLDRSAKGTATLTPQEQRGFELFFTESEPRLGKLGADCFHCHGGAHFTDHSFHNNGLAPTDDIGLGKITGKPSDRYKFSTPTLRNIALTAPYMHDGRFATLEEVIAHYNSPIAPSETLDPNIAKHPRGLGLNESDVTALIVFLKTLTDPAMQDQ